MKNYTKIILSIGLLFFVALSINAQGVIPGSVITDDLNDDNTILTDWLDDNGQVPSGTLLYRRSTHGANVNTFHNLVDEKGPTLVIFKASNGQVFGGYTPNSWSSTSRGYKRSTEAFLFNLNTNRKATSRGPHLSIYTYPSLGPTFGGGWDIHINGTMDGGYITGATTYNSIDGSGNFTSSALTALTGVNNGSWFFSFGSGFITEIEVYLIEFDVSIPAEIVCPANITVNNDTGQCGAAVSFTATETIGIPASTITYSHVSGSEFPVGTTTVTATATNAVGTDSCTFTITVNDTEAPVISCPSDITGVVATSASGAVVTYTVPTGTDNCSAAETALTAGFASGATFLIGVTTVTYEVTDAANLTAECSFTVTVTGVLPQIVCPADITVNNDPTVCGANVTFSASDAVGIPASTITYAIQPSTLFDVGTTSVTATATNAVGSSSCEFTITVTNSAPDNVVITGQATPQPIGSNVDVSATFNDENIDTATWIAFDGNTEVQSETINITGISTNYSFVGLPVGVYTIILKLKDHCDLETTEQWQYAVIYDPNGGFVTGGGWIDSPAGAYVQDPSLTGKANFGFVAKYKTGNNNANEVDGNTNFKFIAGDFHFKSSSHEDMSLVISGERKATYKGIGTVNGAGAYGFMVTVVDGEAPGAGQGDMDTFRIKVWDGSPSNVVYDNEMGSAENTDAMTGLGGGSIVIHKPKGNNKAKSAIIKSEPIEAEIFDGFELVSWPNPSDDYFNIKLKSKNTVDKINIQVFDLNGRLVSFKTGVPNRDYKIGSSLQSGLYFATVSQGNTTKIVKLIKH